MMDKELLNLLHESEDRKDYKHDILIERVQELYESGEFYEDGQLKCDPKAALEFLDLFEQSDPPLTYWYCWLPFRFYMRPERWEAHAKLHNIKVDTGDYSEERKVKLRISLINK